MERIERVQGALFGVACGDALGATLEFLTEEEGKDKYGHLKDIIGGGWLDLQPGEITDDTRMTIAVAEGILTNPENPIQAIGNNFVKWYLSGPKDIGITCETSIKRFLQSTDWNEASLYVHKVSNGRTAGNGTLMRCIPIALYYTDFEKIIEVTRQQSKMTHYDDLAAEACILYNTLVYRYLEGEGKEKVIKETIEVYKDYKEILNIKKEDLNPSGYVVDSLKCALWCFINYSNPEEIICEAVNLCGDADTIGAIAGGLSGVYYGYESIPIRWKDRIIVKDKLQKIVGEILINDFISKKFRKV